MRNTKMLVRSAAGVAALFSASALAQAASDPTGVWLNDTGRGAIEIKQCGKALCGHVVWLKDGADAKGCGKQIIGEAVKVGSSTWDNGWIYSPEKRKNFDVELTPLSDGTLQVMGYAGVKFLSKTMIWTRAPADLKRCGETVAAVTPSAPATAAAVIATLPAPGTAAKSGADSGTPASPPSSASPSPQPGSGADSKPADTAKAAPETKTPETAAKPDSDSQSKGDAKSHEAPAAREEKKSAEAKPSNDDDDEGGEKPGQRSKKGGVKIGGIDLDQVLTRTKSGKCKLDLPWVKVQFDCNKD